MNTQVQALLSERHLQHLRASAISDEIIIERGYQTVTTYDEYRSLDPGVMPDRQVKVPAIAFPAYRLGDPNSVVWTLRPDDPRSSKTESVGGEVKAAKFVKYEWPAGVPTTLDVLPRFGEALGDPSIPIWITEGAKKADAMATHMPDIVPISLNGVWGWITTNKNGGRLVNGELYEIAWNGREVVLAFDSDLMDKPQVLKALNELAERLIAREAVVRVLYLPNTADQKLGIDDVLAQGMTVEDIKANVHPWAGQPKRGGTRLHTNLGLGHEVQLPGNYEYDDGELRRLMGKDQWVPIYHGQITVESTGVDLSTKEEVMTVVFTGSDGKPQRVTAPRAELCRAKGVMDHLGSRGAAVHEENAKGIAVYLIEFANHNRDKLSRSQHTARLGRIEEGLITPAGSVGFAQPVTYDGDHKIEQPDNLDTERQVFEIAKEWAGAYPFWLARSMALASPFLTKLGVVRNPVIAFVGESNGGKTTTINSGMSAWGVPDKTPFRVTVTSTLVGFSERVKELNGLPLLLDEVHNHAKPEVLRQQVYDYANRDTRTKGRRSGGVMGGELVGGVLFLAGEASFEFEHRGIANRVLFIDTNRTPPLGVDAPSGSKLGEERSNFLNDAWRNGCGAFGLKIAERILANWSDFVKTCKIAEEELNITCDTAWRRILAVAAVMLHIAFEELDVSMSNGFVQENLDAWVAMLTNGRAAADPAMEAWMDVLTLFGRGRTYPEGDWTILEVRNERTAYRKNGDDFWRLPTGGRKSVFVDEIGKDAVKRHGRAWARMGLIIPDKNGDPAYSVSVKGGFNQQCLKVKVSALQGEEN